MENEANNQQVAANNNNQLAIGRQQPWTCPLLSQLWEALPES